ncbi:uncharacterized protein TNCT_709511 [Trichonephila clavata]|uniref:Monocarboxylate transporter n=1 Tax=Trichonephila clavata TaxID=2740835 RepID=A0A8X6KDG3_TRICU|nr:uncharacterized protein TNCT_709511 [Trichonephila clavata]
MDALHRRIASSSIPIDFRKLAFSSPCLTFGKDCTQLDMWKFSRSDIRSGIALAMCFSLFGILSGIPRLSSLLFVASISRYNVDRKQASFPFVLLYAVRTGSGPIVGYLGKRFNPKIITVSGTLLSSISVFGCFFAEDITTITVLWGIGFGFGYGLATLLIPQVLSYHFSRHMHKSTGLTFSSECVMFFLLSPVLEALLKTYDLSGAFLILSGIILHTVLAAMLLEIPETSNTNACCDTPEVQSSQKRELKPEWNGTEEVNTDTISAPSKSAEMNAVEKNSQNTSMKVDIEKKTEQNAFRVFLNPIYILLMLSMSAMAYTYTIMTTVVIDVSRDHGVTEDEEVYILMGLAVLDAVGRMSLGFITDSGYLTKTTFSALCFGGISVALIFFISIGSLTAILISVLFVQFFLAGLIIVGSVIFFDYVEEEHISIALASRQLLHMPFSFTQAPLIGYFRDTLQSYNGLFYILIAICCTSCIINLLIPSLYRCQRERRERLKADRS